MEMLNLISTTDVSLFGFIYATNKRLCHIVIYWREPLTVVPRYDLQLLRRKAKINWRKFLNLNLSGL